MQLTSGVFIDGLTVDLNSSASLEDYLLPDYFPLPICTTKILSKETLFNPTSMKNKHHCHHNIAQGVQAQQRF